MEWVIQNQQHEWIRHSLNVSMIYEVYRRVTKRTMHCSVSFLTNTCLFFFSLPQFFLFCCALLLSCCLIFPRKPICTFNTIIKWCLCMRARLFFFFSSMFPLLCNWKLIVLVFIVFSAKRSHRGNEKRSAYR